MARNALIISDNDALAAVYAANLNVYVGLTIYTARNETEAVSNLGKPNFFHVVISAYSLENGEEIAGKALEAVNSKKLKSNFVVVNNTNKNETAAKIPPAVLYIPNPFDIKNLVRSVARMLGVTAKEMSRLEVPEYFPLPVRLLQWLEEPKWDLYIEKESEFKRIAYKNEKLDVDVNALVQEGVESVYVNSSERLRCANSLTAGAVLLLKKNATPKEKLKASETSLEALSTMLLKSDADRHEVAEIGKACIAAIDEAIKESDELSALLAYLKENNSSYLYLHSVLTNYVCQHILKNISWGNTAQMEKMSYVCFFHDIFLVPVYQNNPDIYEVEELAFSNQADEDDLEHALKHARMAAEKVAMLPKMPMGVDTIILQHHGVKNGEGFSLDPGDDISPLAKVMIVAEAFVNFFMEVKDKGQTFDNEGFMTFLKQQYTRNSYHKIIDTLKNFA